MADKIFYYFLIFGFVTFNNFIIRMMVPAVIKKNDFKNIASAVFYNVAICFVIPAFLAGILGMVDVLDYSEKEDNSYSQAFCILIALAAINLFYCLFKVFGDKKQV